MNNLVIMKEQEAVTTSLQVASVFSKRHSNVIRAIELKISQRNFEPAKKMFMPSSYKDEQGKERKMYYMNRDGFTFIAFGFTGAKADEFKLKYIEAFNAMENSLKQVKVPTTTKELIELALRASQETTERVEKLESDVNYLNDTMRITGIQQKQLQDAGKRSAIKALGGSHSEARKDRSLTGKVFGSMWSEFKNHFIVPRYSELPAKRFNEGMYFLNNWEPKTGLKMVIEEANGQLNLLEVGQSSWN